MQSAQHQVRVMKGLHDLAFVSSLCNYDHTDGWQQSPVTHHATWYDLSLTQVQLCTVTNDMLTYPTPRRHCPISLLLLANTAISGHDQQGNLRNMSTATVYLADPNGFMRWRHSNQLASKLHMMRVGDTWIRSSSGYGVKNNFWRSIKYIRFRFIVPFCFTCVKNTFTHTMTIDSTDSPVFFFDCDNCLYVCDPFFPCYNIDIALLYSPKILAFSSSWDKSE